MKHTPLPWMSEGRRIFRRCIGGYKGIKDESVAVCYGHNQETQEANAKNIVHAVNMHEKIVEALKHAHNSLRTFRNVPKDDQEWTPIDDEVMKLIEETLSQAERK